uniref:Uncharacterized protein n=1 Tax=Phakopsora pachyrhizi TaxID=170000 RepID=A0A0S1MI99_PHAPC
MYSKVFKLYLFFISVGILAVFQGARTSPVENVNMPAAGSSSQSHTDTNYYCVSYKPFCKRYMDPYKACPLDCHNCNYC